MRVLEAQPVERVLWEVVDGPEEWIGTRISFEPTQEDGFTIVLFRHEGWKEPVEFMYHCSTTWGVFLMSPKKLVEIGEGEPAPHGVRRGDRHEPRTRGGRASADRSPVRRRGRCRVPRPYRDDDRSTTPAWAAHLRWALGEDFTR
ncbi:hypothetical protein [Nocardiopsis sp. FIRDI 009]|uniref:hypothetical protein n=1 Tax=Nocardiopsis sp. FIRDI 009 TaxID=714197 RepID=UPI0018E4FB3D|nr:hypothetical protein [Nocardiopsis sp. FIRDI 009]